MKERDVADLLKGHLPPKVVEVFVKIVARQRDLHDQQVALAKGYVSLCEILDNHGTIAAKMKDSLEKVENRMQSEEVEESQGLSHPQVGDG